MYRFFVLIKLKIVCFINLNSTPGKALKTLNTSTTAVAMPPNHDRCVARSGSVPNLASFSSQHLSENQTALQMSISPILRSHTRQHNIRTSNSVVNRATKETNSGSHLHPGVLQCHRQTLSIDESCPFYSKILNGRNGMETNFSLSAPPPRIRDKTKRSDTARKHLLSRQKPIEKDEMHRPKGSHR